MKVSYDPKTDSMYLYISSKKKSTETVEVNEDVLVDYAGKEVIGIEILDASKKLPKNELKNINPLIH